MNEYPKVLVLGVDAWRYDSPSNTLSNIFSSWDADKVALVYTRSNYPNCPVSNSYFQISENKVLKSVFKPWMQTGCMVENTVKPVSKVLEQEQKRYAKAHKKHSFIMTLGREAVWFLGHWKKKDFKKFISDYSPDVLFLPIYNTWYMCRLERFLIRFTKKPYVIYYADDDYSYEACEGVLSYFHRFILRKYVKKLIENSDEAFVIADKVKEEIDTLFHKNCRILTKGIDFSTVECQKFTIHRPIRFVYTGNLLIGRDTTLISIADALNRLDPSGECATLDIYSQTELSDQTIAKLNHGNCHFHGHVPREKVDQIQREADVLIFAEALNGKYAHAARMSFSTKLTDYMASCKCIFAVGTSEIAPIHYLRKHDAAIISTSDEEITANIQRILTEPKQIEYYGMKAFECAKAHHDKAVIDETFHAVMQSCSARHQP